MRQADPQQLRFNAPFAYGMAIIASGSAWIIDGNFWCAAGLGLTLVSALTVVHFELSGATWDQWRTQLLRGFKWRRS